MGVYIKMEGGAQGAASQMKQSRSSVQPLCHCLSQDRSCQAVFGNPRQLPTESHSWLPHGIGFSALMHQATGPNHVVMLFHTGERLHLCPFWAQLWLYKISLVACMWARERKNSHGFANNSGMSPYWCLTQQIFIYFIGLLPCPIPQAGSGQVTAYASPYNIAKSIKIIKKIITQQYRFL